MKDTHWRPLSKEQVAEAVSDPAERAILSLTIGAAKSPKDLSDEARIPLASTYRHINKLLERGLLIVDRGAITPDGKRVELYRSRVTFARLDVVAGQIDVAWKLDEAVEDRLVRVWNQLRP